MQQFLTSSLYNSKKLFFNVAIKAHKRSLQEIIDQWKAHLRSLLFSQIQLESDNANTEPDVTLFLNNLPKKYINSKIKNSHPLFFDAIQCIPTSNSQDKRNFILYTKGGSFIKTDLKKKIAVGKIIKNEQFIYILLHLWLNRCIIGHYLINLHAACLINKKGLSLLFIGKNGAGKSTICDLLDENDDFKTIHDDCIIANTAFEKINIIDYNYNASYDHISSEICPSHIFFIHKNKALKTRITAISKKEAFKRIIFASAFPKNENGFLRQHRLDSLGNLVKQCRCHLLINGKGLKKDPVGFKRLLESIINKYSKNIYYSPSAGMF